MRPYSKTLSLASGLLLICAVSCNPSRHAEKTPPQENIGAPNEPHTPAGTPQAQQGVNPSQATRVLHVQTDHSFPEYKPNKLTVTAGETVSLTFTNTNNEGDDHGLIIVLPGKENEVGTSASQSGPSHQWTPSKEVEHDIVAKTRLLAPGESETITFRAPDTPGDYPFICPSSKHWREMNGVLEVKKPS